jgi:excisionase family DNA binding protein
LSYPLASLGAACGMIIHLNQEVRIARLCLWEGPCPVDFPSRFLYIQDGRSSTRASVSYFARDPAMEKLLSTKEVADFLGVNEKMIYTLINEKGLPATRITGKWLFPKDLVDQWLMSKTVNFPRQPESAVQVPNLLLVAGSNDILLDCALVLFRRLHPEYVALNGNLGSLGGLLERREELAAIRDVGVPVVSWRGSGSLDPFLREIARRAVAPKLARR